MRRENSPTLIVRTQRFGEGGQIIGYLGREAKSRTTPKAVIRCKEDSRTDLVYHMGFSIIGSVLNVDDNHVIRECNAITSEPASTAASHQFYNFQNLEYNRTRPMG